MFESLIETTTPDLRDRALDLALQTRNHQSTDASILATAEAFYAFLVDDDEVEA